MPRRIARGLLTRAAFVVSNHRGCAFVKPHDVCPRRRAKGPKKARNAFLWFLEARRPQVAEANPELKPGAISSLISSQWKELAAEEKAPFEEVAAADKARYARECEETGFNPDEAKAAKEAAKAEAKAKADVEAAAKAAKEAKDAAKGPRKARNAFLHFSEARRAQVAEARRGLANAPRRRRRSLTRRQRTPHHNLRRSHNRNFPRPLALSRARRWRRRTQSSSQALSPP